MDAQDLACVQHARRARRGERERAPDLYRACARARQEMRAGLQTKDPSRGDRRQEMSAKEPKNKDLLFEIGCEELPATNLADIFETAALEKTENPLLEKWKKAFTDN